MAQSRVTCTELLKLPPVGVIVGCATVGVVVGDQVVLLKGYGFADREGKRAMTPDTLLPIASVTKQFTAASVLLLAQDGRLGLDDPVRRWLPTLPKAADAITVRRLLTHTSGLIDYEDVIPESLTRQLHDADVLR